MPERQNVTVSIPRALLKQVKVVAAERRAGALSVQVLHPDLVPGHVGAHLRRPVDARYGDDHPFDGHWVSGWPG